MKTVLTTLAFALLLGSTTLYAQQPVVTGDTMLCPNGTGVLTTGTYTSYQWLVRTFGSSTTNPIPGATQSSLTVDYVTYAPSYISVQVVDSTGDTLTSAEVLVDGWVFVPPVVMTTGNYTIGPNGESIICPGDTMYFTLMSPWDTHITWFMNGDTLHGETGTVLTVTTPGDYWVTGATSICPDFIQSPGVVLTVENCQGAGRDFPAAITLRAFPNPVRDRLTLHSPQPVACTLYDAAGRVHRHIPLHAGETSVDVQELPAGVYFLRGEGQPGAVRILKY